MSPKKAHEQMYFNDDGNSNEIDESRSQFPKQEDPRIST
jgi:hypothetical protein